jgi:hypothetical protein
VNNNNKPFVDKSNNVDNKINSKKTIKQKKIATTRKIIKKKFNSNGKS